MSRATGSLAVLGAAPAFAEPLHVGCPSIGNRQAFLDRLASSLDRRRLTNDGPCVTELERRLEERLGVRHCVAMSSGTTALSLLARAAGLSGEVILPSFTFVATAHALEWMGLTPVFCDIDPVTWTLDPAACEAAVTPATSAILGVHVFGHPCDVPALRAVADRHGLVLLFDAAHAFGCSYEDGRPVGGEGMAEALSFHATKVFHTFEGGAITTDHDALAAELRLLRNFGFRDTDDVVCLGINGKMSEPSAAMGLANLDALETTMAAGRAVLAAYADGLAGVPGVRLRLDAAGPRRNGHYAILEVADPALFGLDRDTLVHVLTAERVLARRYFAPGVHAMQPYHRRDPHAGAGLPVTCGVVSRVVALPAGAAMPLEAVPRVCEIIASAHAHAREIRAGLPARAPAANDGI